MALQPKFPWRLLSREFGITETVENRTPATYVAIRQCIGCSPNKVSTALQTLTERGLIKINRGKRQRNV